jgi:mycothione reductase
MRTYDLLVLGAGSGNMLFTPELHELDAAIVEPRRFGGTCLNRGCNPSNTLGQARDVLYIHPALTSRRPGAARP